MLATVASRISHCSLIAALFSPAPRRAKAIRLALLKHRRMPDRNQVFATGKAPFFGRGYADQTIASSALGAAGGHGCFGWHRYGVEL